MRESHGQPFERSHIRVSKSALFAAHAHVRLSQGHPSSYRNWSISLFPFPAAALRRSTCEPVMRSQCKYLFSARMPAIRCNNAIRWTSTTFPLTSVSEWSSRRMPRFTRDTSIVLQVGTLFGDHSTLSFLRYRCFPAQQPALPSLHGFSAFPSPPPAPPPPLDRFCSHRNVDAVHAQPLRRAHFRTSSCPCLAARVQVASVHGHPSPLTHCKTSKCPPSAAFAEVPPPQGHPFCRAHFRTFGYHESRTDARGS